MVIVDMVTFYVRRCLGKEFREGESPVLETERSWESDVLAFI